MRCVTAVVPPPLRLVRCFPVVGIVIIHFAVSLRFFTINHYRPSRVRHDTSVTPVPRRIAGFLIKPEFAFPNVSSRGNHYTVYTLCVRSNRFLFFATETFFVLWKYAVLLNLLTVSVSVGFFFFYPWGLLNRNLCAAVSLKKKKKLNR